MAQWVGDTAVEATYQLNENYKRLLVEIEEAHKMLDDFGIPRDYVNGHFGRPFSLRERMLAGLTKTPEEKNGE
tara:strand:- start:308 stop:526 length:219 start_codon:yes stop_codon:yes gene_type:complete